MCSCSCVRIHSLNKAKNYNMEACFELAAEESSQTLWPVVPASAAGKLEKANINANKRDSQCIVISCFLMKDPVKLSSLTPVQEKPSPTSGCILPLFISGLRCMSSKERDTKAQHIRQGRDSKMTC